MRAYVRRWPDRLWAIEGATGVGLPLAQYRRRGRPRGAPCAQRCAHRKVPWRGRKVSDAQGVTRRDPGQPGWVVNGAKMWCTYADQADYIILFARTDPEVDPKRRHLGISTFIIEKQRGSFPDGISGTPMRTIGYRGWKTWELSFDNFRLPGEAMVGEEGRGFYAAMDKLDIGRAFTAARSIGLARGALEEAIAYANQRKQFGRPISDFQALRFKIVDMAAQVEASRQLMYHVCTKIDSGERSDLESSMVKYQAAEMSARVTSEGLQVHGGAGYTTEFAAERHWRDARLTRIFEGTSEIRYSSSQIACSARCIDGGDRHLLWCGA
jgi:alkylation response protein AidB-like acyl-CoA dehydrogenase